MQVHSPLISPVFPGLRPARRNRLRWRAAVQVDAGEDHGQLRRLQFDAVWRPASGHLEGAGLEPLVPDGQAVTVEVEDLDAIPAAVEEEEEMAGQEVLAEAFLDQTRKAIKRGIFLIPLAAWTVRTTSRPSPSSIRVTLFMGAPSG